jgi:hypothetical protein
MAACDLCKIHCTNCHRDAKEIHMKVGENFCTRGLVYLHVAVQGPKAWYTCM